MNEFFSRLWSAEMERLKLLVDYWYVWVLFILAAISFAFLTSNRKK
ncbi:hypothetical protein [Heyndrickxia sporothermodurans]|nr:hypothetical protein [Heyndrickxia sporothermodurans]